MKNLIPARTVSTLPRKLALPLLLVGALLSMGAKWAEKPIESLASIARDPVLGAQAGRQVSWLGSARPV